MTARHGWLVIDKPVGMTSRAVVDAAQKWFAPKTAIGHTGTLDPLASGVLVLGIGIATRLVEFVQDLRKVYGAEITLGATSATDDAEGPIVPVDSAADPGRIAFEAACTQFEGVIEQVPPNYSAVWVNGRRAYKEARKGRRAELTARSVRIDSIKLLSYDYPRVRVEVQCGKGTYIRSLARDLGAVLECGGYVSQLRRTAIGAFDIGAAVALEAGAVELLPLARGVGGLPRIELTAANAAKLKHGNVIVEAEQREAAPFAAAFFEDCLFAIVTIRPDGSIQPLKVLAWQQ